jgi:hypothetical protein
MDRVRRPGGTTMHRTTCCTSVSSLVVLAVLVVAAGSAAAQAPGAPPGAPADRAPPTASPTVAQEVAHSFRRWGIGAHVGGLGVVSARDAGAEDEIGLGLVGAHLRYRLHPRWELEVDLSAMGGELSGPGDMRRTTGALILGGMFHLNPDSVWLCSVLFGVGAARDVIWYEKNGDHRTHAEFVEGLGRVGVGLERRFDQVGIAAQLYAVGMVREDEELDGPDYVGRDGPVPEESGGGQFQLLATYYF